MSDLNNLHDQAMDFADEADFARRKGNLDEARALYLKAYQIEVQVARQISHEPSRSVVYRSAAALALDCGLLDEARELVMTALAGQPPFEIDEELREILAEVQAQDMTIQSKNALDFAAIPAVVRAVTEAERLAFGHLFNPAFATEISAIEPLPHQRIAVYDHLLKNARLRFLLADDAGAGKTIMSGLYIREMLSRRLIQRVLIVPPAGLVGNWHREMERLFNLPFRIVSGKDVPRGNPFSDSESDLVIVSIDTLSTDRMFAQLKDVSTPPYDLVIFDEAHKLSANRDADFTVRKTGRYKVAEALMGMSSNGMSLDWSARHLLLLSATPHMGRDYPYYALWHLMEPEILSTPEAFEAYPPSERQKHFIRRTKEEMVRFDGTPIYPKRITDTLSYDLTQGNISEQKLYDETTDYIRFYYNRARILNRSAARLAISVFQRRLASSTYALMQSLDRRIKKLDGLIEGVEMGMIDLSAYATRQHELNYALDEKTADEEDTTEDGQERSEADEELLMGGVVAVSLAELAAERRRVEEIRNLAMQVSEKGDESKLQRLLDDVIRNQDYRDEKLIIFTEHRDTLEFIVRRLEGLGFTGEIARLHGGMDYPERDRQVELFRKRREEGGANYLVATDAAGEGINLQFCWLMVNYDIPWNPARLEQRMGRIHRYGQRHDPVVILNLVAGKTREGHVLRTLLDKLERIRRELGSDKVFDVVGRLFQGISIREYMERVLTDEDGQAAEKEIDSLLTSEQVKLLDRQERELYGEGGDVRNGLPGVRAEVERADRMRLLPGYVRRFIEESAPLMGLEIDGDLDKSFTFRAMQPGALNPLIPAIEHYPEGERSAFSVGLSDGPTKSGVAPIVLRPGEPIFDHFRAHIINTLGSEAQRGGVFIDPTASQPYVFHVARIRVVRRADPEIHALMREEIIETCLVGLRQTLDGEISEYPVESLLLLRDGTHSSRTLPLVIRGNEFAAKAKSYVVGRVAAALVAQHRDALINTIDERERFLHQGFRYEESELATRRTQLREKAKTDKAAGRKLEQIRENQRLLTERQNATIRVLHREPELIELDAVEFIAHALVMPSTDPEDRKRYDAAVEATAVRVAWAYEADRGATVQDVSTPDLARAAGLGDHPGFDLLAAYPNGETRNIEVKGRAAVGDVELTQNEWARACNLRQDYWLYVVFNCATTKPILYRVRDPFGNLIAKSSGVLIAANEILKASEN